MHIKHPESVKNFIAARLKEMHIIDPPVPPRKVAWSGLISKIVTLSRDLDDPDYVLSILDVVIASPPRMSAFVVIQSDLIGELAGRTMEIGGQLYHRSFEICNECKDVRSLYGVKCLARLEPWQQIKDIIYTASLNPHPTVRSEAICVIQRRAEAADYSHFLVANHVISENDADADVVALTNLACARTKTK
jgi:hypothetical protein